ncbi:MAG TPA: TIR domain-containing protein [Rhodanobacteraceae bacterium]|nr:TIR domain-containing protein [Rhodanobacteraceae bacterium]
MADVFVSYARADKARVAPLVAAIEARGWSVWWDPEITPGQEFDDQIDAEIDAAKAVLVVWTPTSVASRWVRGEAREAAERGILVPVRFEQARLPMDVRAIHTTDLDDWREDPAHPALQDCLHALGGMIARAQAAAQNADSAGAVKPQVEKTPHYSICVLPFVNMSGDAEQEYFSDGITEDIITDLSKLSALEVVSRNDSFLYKGKQIEVLKVAREAKVTHVLEGSVRRAGGRLRITAQLIDGAGGKHIWAERYDRDASDIFAIQDEISQAIVKALRLRLLPEEKKAIEHRGTDSVEAHDLYLMARQLYVTTSEGDTRSAHTIIRICTSATEIDPTYARAWALMAMAYRSLREYGKHIEDGMAAAEKALALDPDLVEAHAVKAYILTNAGDTDGAAAEVAIALKLDPESYEANRAAGRHSYRLHRFRDAIRFYEKASSLMEADVNSSLLTLSSYKALNDKPGTRRAAEALLKRADAALAKDSSNAGIMAYSTTALGALGEGERAKARMRRAMMIDPDNTNMRYNFACMLCTDLRDKDAALKMLEPVFAGITDAFLPYAKADPDLTLLYDDPRYQAMVAAAEARLAAAKTAIPATVGGADGHG